MKTKLTETKFTSDLGLAGWLISRIACLAAVILTCSSASAQNLFVTGYHCGGDIPSDVACGRIFEFTGNGGQSIFASGLNDPGDLAFDSTGNLFVVDYDAGHIRNNSATIYKYSPNGSPVTLASGLSVPLYLAVDRAGALFVADYEQGVIYKYKATGSRAKFASGLYHPVAMAFDWRGNLFVVDTSIGNVYQGSIYEYKPDGSRVTFAVLEPFDRPADLAFDTRGNLLMADLDGNIYKYDPHGVRKTFGSVPDSAQSLAVDNAGNLFVVDGNAIYKFTPQGAQSMFAKGQTLGETFSCLAFQPEVCCQ